MENYDINSTNIEFGDAAFSMYYICFDKSKDNDTNKIVANVFHKHSYYELHLINEGKTSYNIDGKKIDVKVGQLLIIPPEVVHLTDCKGEKVKRTVISVALRKIQGEKGCYKYFKSRLEELSLNPETVTVSIAYQINKFAEINNTNLQNFCRQKASAYNLILDLLCEKGEVPVGKHNNSDTERKFLLENMINDNRFSINETAKQLGYSKRHTSRLIKEQYGKSLLQLRKANMQATVDMMKKDGNMTKSEIERIIYKV